MLVYNQPKHRANIDYSSESQSQELNNTLYSVNSPAQSLLIHWKEMRYNQVGHMLYTPAGNSDQRAGI